MDAMKLAEEIVSGRRLQRGDEALTALLSSALDALCRAADFLRRGLRGEKVNLCTIISGKSGRCGEDCKYCAQSAFSRTGCEEYSFLDPEVIVAAAKVNEAEGVDRFSIVTSGKALTGADFEKAVRSYERLSSECQIALCASMGFLTAEQFQRLRQAGVTRYHDNIETSRRFFPQICTTHSFDQKLEAIRNAQQAGLSVCSGGIIGMGESWEDRIDMALTLSELGILSIPINVLIPVKGTPMEQRPLLKDEEVLRTVALFRFINPEAHIRLAGGRRILKENGRRCFEAGASAAITGNMLTTGGSTIAQDRAMLIALGRDVRPESISYHKPALLK